MSSNADKYGSYYYGVQVAGEVSPDGKIFLFADRTEINDDGTLLF